MRGGLRPGAAPQPQDTYQQAAERELDLIDHTMALENQAVGDEDDDEQLRRFIVEDLDPRDLWTGR